MNNYYRYFILGAVFWVTVDFTTAFCPDVQRWISYMPDIWLFYFGYPLLFGNLIYKKHLKDNKLVLAMLSAAFLIEVILSHNALLYTFPIMLVMIPIAVCIYGFITFVPVWLVEKRLIENKKKIVLLTLVWIIVSILNFATNNRAG